MSKNWGPADWIDERRERFIAMSDNIWAHPQVALAETYACQLQADDLAAEASRSANVGGMPTAFTASGAAARRSSASSASTMRCRTSRRQPSRRRSRSSPAGRGTAAATTCSAPPALAAAMRAEGVAGGDRPARHGALLRLPGRGDAGRQGLHGARRRVRRPRRRVHLAPGCVQHASQDQQPGDRPHQVPLPRRDGARRRRARSRAARRSTRSS